MSKRILVFPCGSEIGLEIHRSIRYSTHFELVGASSVDDHGRFVFEEYVGGVPHHLDISFAVSLERIVREYRIDAIYPAMDAVAETIQNIGAQLGVVVIGSTPMVTSLCASKTATYKSLHNVVDVPEYYQSLGQIPKYPIFIKPDRGYGSRNTCYATDLAAANNFLDKFESGSMIFVEYLPGEEWTIDCFSDRHGKLRYHAARSRSRISNGISVHTKPSSEHEQKFKEWAHAIQKKLQMRGAWFFQAKLAGDGQPKLLEVAARLGGSSSLFRCQGVNFALLSVFDAFDHEIAIDTNGYNIEMDRALDNRYKLDIQYDHVFVDLDDCLIVRGKVNCMIISFLYKAIADGKKITLLTRHYCDPMITLREHRISELFDRVIHINNRDEKKSKYIDDKKSIFIDDSYVERSDVSRTHGIAVFSPDMIEALL